MKLAVSNIAWPAELDEQAFETLHQLGISAIEFAPTRIWPDWNDATPDAARNLRQQLQQSGFSIPSLQAILFGRPDCQLFGTSQQRDELSQHLQRCADLAVVLGATSLVFGAPKNRDPGHLPPAQAFDMAAETFRQAGGYYADRNVCLCLEANPPQYACRFATNSHDAAALVRAVDSPGFRLHLDTACMALAGENVLASISQHFPLLQHFHASEPNLGAFHSLAIDHQAVGSHLQSLGYFGWVSLEMRQAPEPLIALREAIQLLTAAY